MEREGDRITFEDAERDILAEFERGVAGARGMKALAGAILRACTEAGDQQVIAWQKIRDRFVAAGLVEAGDEIVYHFEREEFTVKPARPPSGGRRHLQDILTHLEAAKVEAVRKKRFITAAHIRNAADSLRGSLRLTSEADTPPDAADETATPDDKSEDAEPK